MKERKEGRERERREVIDSSGENLNRHFTKEDINTHTHTHTHTAELHCVELQGKNSK